jgi:hypothetical protein
MIAALFVETGGVYFGLPDVDPWDEERDARKYAGPWPVVAHPPCAAWCRLAGLREHRYGYKKGDDGGCFGNALLAVRLYGGVLEHPAYTDAFAAFGLPAPLGMGWQRTTCGGWVCYVEQWFYGHRARKGTWLYAHGIQPPSLDWRRADDDEELAPVIDERGTKRVRAQVGWQFVGPNCRGEAARRKPLSKREAKATPIAFRDLLLDIARSAGSTGLLRKG